MWKTKLDLVKNNAFTSALELSSLGLSVKSKHDQVSL